MEVQIAKLKPEAEFNGIKWLKLIPDTQTPGCCFVHLYSDISDCYKWDNFFMSEADAKEAFFEEHGVEELDWVTPESLEQQGISVYRDDETW